MGNPQPSRSPLEADGSTTIPWSYRTTGVRL
nr:MAG TPA: hypothetical protein [Caudoviricetes sp.]